MVLTEAKHYKPNVAYELLIDGKYRYYGSHCRKKDFLYESEIRQLSGNALAVLHNTGVMSKEEYNNRTETLYIWEFDSPEEALERETELILIGKYLYGDLCLNKMIGNNKSYIIPDDIKDKIRAANKNYHKNNPSIRAFYVECGYKGMERNPHKAAKKVAQIDKDTGEIIKVYKSINEASRETGADHRNITRAASGKYKIVGGFKWKYLTGSGC